MRHFIIICVLFFSAFRGLQAQDKDLSILTFDEYLGFVKSFHPIVRQANIDIDESQAKLMKARGAFDPKLEVDYNRKKFKGTEYFDRLNATFKIPTWYGIEFKGNFEDNSGVYLNPQAKVPEDGLYNVGVSVSLAKGLLMNKRMAMLKQAKLFLEQTKADRQLMVNDILYESSLAYFNWIKAYKKKTVYENFLENAELRFNAVKKNYELGDKPAIDTLEAKITVQNRKLELEKSRIQFIKASLELSNFLWLDNYVPLEIQDNVIPDVETPLFIDEVLQITDFDLQGILIEQHPKMQSLRFKYDGLDIERRLMANNLLPQVDLEYNFLSETPEVINSFNTANYKAGLGVRFPLLLRKERGDLKLAKLKLQDMKYEMALTEVSLKNKFDALSQQVDSYNYQTQITDEVVQDYGALLKAEERKFSLGESSLFLINSRESKLIESQLKAVDIENELLSVKADLFRLSNGITQE